MQEYKQSSIYFIRVILKWKFQFLIVTVAAILFAGLFSSEWFIKPKYKSVALVYPSNLKPYSSESESEQLLQFFLSADVREEVATRFNLAHYYGIDTAQMGGMSKLIAAWESNVEINRTQFESIEIKVWDTDPKMARDIAAAIIDALNHKVHRIQQEKAAEVVKLFHDQLTYKKTQIDSLNDSLEVLRVRYQILDYESQAKEATKAWLRAVGSGKSNVKDLDVLLRNLGEKGGEYYEMSKTMEGFLKSYNNTRSDYDNAVRDMNKELSYTNIVTRPQVPDRKSYPIRWLIVLISVLSANMFLFVVIMAMDSRKQIVSEK